ncbi:hypothetical protein [Actinomadura flavalba]|uniref:hypothetical protein n=1 Tax=Actinomadura flavalba TaxID=1120938 RepID=UPI00036826FE|nr:hypothetical protein [Actinomadura flavalba]
MCGATRCRAAFASGGLVFVALGLLVALAATGGETSKIVTQGRWVPAVLLLALLVATLTCATAAAVPPALRTAGVPAALGPVAAAVALGGRETVALAQRGDGSAPVGYLDGVQHPMPSILVLLAAAFVLAALTVAGLAARRGVPAGEAAPS